MENSAPIDYISTLPDEILIHILSFLPTKLAFSTTILSKRWAPLYRSLTSLHFDDESVHNKWSFHQFHCFVDKVMLSTKLIKTFHLTCCSDHWQKRRTRFIVESWIQRAKRHPVENIDISNMLIDEIPMRTSIFRFPTLVVLKLWNCHVAGNFSINLPSLKTLHLCELHFKNKDNFNKLLNGCPILEDLIVNVYYREEDKEEVEDVMVSTRKFKHLTKLIKADINVFSVPYRPISNVETLTLRVNRILPEPDNNSYFREFLVFQNLIQLDISFFIFRHWDDAMEMLHNCPNLQILSIEKANICNPDLFINWKYPNSVPKCISSRLKSCTLEYDGFVDELRFATYILQNAPLLEVMDIYAFNEFGCDRDALKELTSCPRISPICKLII